MTGSTDSDANPVHSVAEVEGLNLLEPASKKEFITKNLYPGLGNFVPRNLAIWRMNLKGGSLKNLWAEFRSKPFWQQVDYLMWRLFPLLIFIEFLALLVFSYGELAMWFNALDEVWRNIFKGSGIVVVIFFSIIQIVGKGIPVMPDSNSVLDEKFSSNSRKILMDDINPKWINAYLIRAWPILKDTDNLDLETQNQTHQGIVERSLKFGKENSSWSTLNKYCLEFLIKWSMEKPDERIPMILWTFNPPGSESGKWGESREQHIEFAQHQFSNQIRESIRSMDKLTTRDKTLVDWEQNGYSSQWLKSQMTDKTPRNNTLVKTLTKWSSLES